jgi:hypothetical protein
VVNNAGYVLRYTDYRLTRCLWFQCAPRLLPRRDLPVILCLDSAMLYSIFKPNEDVSYREIHLCTCSLQDTNCRMLGLSRCHLCATITGKSMIISHLSTDLTDGTPYCAHDTNPYQSALLRAATTADADRRGHAYFPKTFSKVCHAETGDVPFSRGRRNRGYRAVGWWHIDSRTRYALYIIRAIAPAIWAWGAIRTLPQ